MRCARRAAPWRCPFSAAPGRFRRHHQARWTGTDPPRLELRQVGRRYADHVSDDAEREGHGETFVDLDWAAGRETPVEEQRREVLDRRTVPADPSRGERALPTGRFASKLIGVRMPVELRRRSGPPKSGVATLVQPVMRENWTVRLRSSAWSRRCQPTHLAPARPPSTRPTRPNGGPRTRVQQSRGPGMRPGRRRSIGRVAALAGAGEIEWWRRRLANCVLAGPAVLGP